LAAENDNINDNFFLAKNKQNKNNNKQDVKIHLQIREKIKVKHEPVKTMN